MNVVEQHIQDVKTKLNYEAIQKALFIQVKKIEKNFTELNKEQIFDFSKDIHGKDIGFYSKGTEEITGGQKREGDPFTGVDSGDWFKGFFIKVENNALLFGSSDEEKNSKIFGKNSTWLSKDLFGLTDDNLNLIIKRDLIPFMQLYARKSIGIE